MQAEQLMTMHCVEAAYIQLYIATAYIQLYIATMLGHFAVCLNAAYRVVQYKAEQ